MRQCVGSPGGPRLKSQSRNHPVALICLAIVCLILAPKPSHLPLRLPDAEIPPGMMYFVSFDLATGYWQILAAKATQDKLAFFTLNGLYKFKRMPMGALNAAPCS
jgi:hypothetical protein